MHHGAAKMGVSDVPAHVLSLVLVAFFFFFFEECFLFPRICLKESHRTAVADGHDTSASPLAGGRTLEARPEPLREGHPVPLEVT